MKTLILGGGCFWCLEPVFSALQGVERVVPGYCGGHVSEPTYEQVCGGDTGHIEVVRVDYDPQQVSTRTLLEIFFHVHDPTTPDRQGHDVGPQYASAIFATEPQQLSDAMTVRDELAGQFDAPICTRMEMAGPFWPAEAVHHDYYTRNPGQGYCQVVIAPKMAQFRRRYAGLLKPAHPAG